MLDEPGCRLAELVGGRGGRAHRGAGADRAERRAAGKRARAADGRAAAERDDAGRADGRAERRAGAELRRAGDEARGDAGTENAEAEQGERWRASGSSPAPISGSCPCSAVVNSVKKFEPMPTMTASTITLMPDD